MTNDVKEVEALRSLVVGMRETYASGGNAMAYARSRASDSSEGNAVTATLIAYDLQAGKYVETAQNNADFNAKWTLQVAGVIQSYFDQSDSILELGVGEATTLAGVLDNLNAAQSQAYGCDISWSRLDVARSWLRERRQDAKLFVADLFDIPLHDASVDIVYTSHSLEPNGGREREALRECLRVAKKAVILIEPVYELASPEARRRMESHGYVRGLCEVAASLDATVAEQGLLELTGNPLNPSGKIVLIKKESCSSRNSRAVPWRCPMTHSDLVEQAEAYASPATGIVYPKLGGIPLLRAQHAVIASRLVT